VRVDVRVLVDVGERATLRARPPSVVLRVTSQVGDRVSAVRARGIELNLAAVRMRWAAGWATVLIVVAVVLFY
jgi:hypothetical protein